MTQTEKIKKFMEDHGSITQREAITYCGCYRLGARIWDLENKKQTPVIHEMIEVQNRDGSKSHIARYRLEERSGDEQHKQ